MGFHIFPSHKKFIEGHLFIPLIHWLPKNEIRRIFIYFFLLFGFDPKWPELKGKVISERVNKYYLFSINKTFYRSYKDIEKIFNKNGFIINYETINNPIIKNNKLISILIKKQILKKIIHKILLNFVSVEILIKKS